MIKNNEFDDHYVSGLIDLGDDANIQQPMEYRRGQTTGRGGEWGYIYMGSKIYLLIKKIRELSMQHTRRALYTKPRPAERW